MVHNHLECPECHKKTMISESRYLWWVWKCQNPKCKSYEIKMNVLDQCPDEFEVTIENVVKIIKGISGEAQTRLDELVVSFNKDFPSKEERYEAQLTAAQYMQSAFILYSFGLNGPAIVEIYGILERIALWYVVQLSQLPLKLLERHTLPDFALALQEFQILDEADIKFIERLTRLRNSLAHKNPNKLANAAFSGRSISFLEIDLEMINVDIIPLINEAIRCLRKITDYYEKVLEKN